MQRVVEAGGRRCWSSSPTGVSRMSVGRPMRRHVTPASHYCERKIVSHTGSLTGMVSRVMMIPDLNLGIVVLTNQDMVLACYRVFSVGAIWSSPVVDKGAVYFGSTDGFLYALQ